jgi:hypothetical protein
MELGEGNRITRIVHFKSTPQGEYLGIYGPKLKVDIITFDEIKWS